MFAACSPADCHSFLRVLLKLPLTREGALPRGSIAEWRIILFPAQADFLTLKIGPIFGFQVF